MINDDADDENLICPITGEYFHDPVLAEDGQLYEREAIVRWINENGTSPLTRQVLNVNHLQPDDEVRRRIDQRRKSPVSYNRTVNPIQSHRFPSSTSNILITNTPVTRRSYPQLAYRPIQHRTTRVRAPNTIWARCSCEKPIIASSICIAICILTAIIGGIIMVNISRETKTTSITKNNTGIIPSTLCSSFNTTPTTYSCLPSFTNVTVLATGICTSFPYRHVQYSFMGASQTTSIIFAFQQTFGYWDIDNIVVSPCNCTRNIFQNGDFKSGSLFPHYSQCQSTGYVNSANRSNGQYTYSDGTQGRFGYLAQTVPTTRGTWYTLSFDLQNRNGSGGSFMLLLST